MKFRIALLIILTVSFLSFVAYTGLSFFNQSPVAEEIRPVVEIVEVKSGEVEIINP